MNNKDIKNSIIPMTKRETNSPYINANPKGNGIKNIIQLENTPEPVAEDEIVVESLAIKNIYQKYGTNSELKIDKTCKSSSDILKADDALFIPMTKREVSSPYICANHTINTQNTPEMDKLKKEPKPRARNLVLVKRSMSKPHKKRKPARRTLLPSEIQKAL
jgi:hypothetical protein